MMMGWALPSTELYAPRSQREAAKANVSDVILINRGLLQAVSWAGDRLYVLRLFGASKPKYLKLAIN